MRESKLVPDISPEQFFKLSGQMLESIKASMVRLEGVVSDMAEILEAWEQDSTREQEIQGMN